jgi:hypothetical protein
MADVAAAFHLVVQVALPGIDGLLVLLYSILVFPLIEESIAFLPELLSIFRILSIGDRLKTWRVWGTAIRIRSVRIIIPSSMNIIN